MGITKLMHIKERKSGKMSNGLKNCIEYIMNPEKTDSGDLVFSNAGENSTEIYNNFIDTKQRYDKLDGRQGYHFVISFSPDEDVSDKQAMNMAKEFVDKYLKDEYDYVCAVHNDTGHKHFHIVFNSVNSKTGLKYRYEKGDWEKYIQPITDDICEENGFERLEFTSFMEDDASDWNKIIMNDIDACISEVSSFEEFLNRMRNEYNYYIREPGVSKKHGKYISLKPHGKKKAVRSYQLPIDYSVDNIIRRIYNKQFDESSPLYSPRINNYKFKKAYRVYSKKNYIKWENMTDFQKERLKKTLEVRKYLGLNKTRPNWETQRLVQQANRNTAATLILIKYSITSLDQARAKLENINITLKNYNFKHNSLKKKYSKYTQGGDNSVFSQYKKYFDLKGKEVLNQEEKVFVSQFEENYNPAYIGEVFKEYQTELNSIKKEKRSLYAQKKQIEDAIKMTYDKKQKEYQNDQERTTKTHTTRK